VKGVRKVRRKHSPTTPPPPIAHRYLSDETGVPSMKMRLGACTSPPGNGSKKN
jgi:hypothetical protein